jgi:hypothetical protein
MDDLGIRPATPEDVREDAEAGDTWAIRRLSLESRSVIEVATGWWGPPGKSLRPGEMVWRLRVNEVVPLYVAIGQDEEPVAMFNLHSRPERAVEETILDKLSGMLVRRDRAPSD